MQKIKLHLKLPKLQTVRSGHFFPKKHFKDAKCFEIHTIRKVKFLSKNSISTKPFHEFFTQIFSTIFLVKSKLSTAKKSKTTTFSRVFHPEKSTIFSGNQSWILGQKMKISNSVGGKRGNWYLYKELIVVLELDRCPKQQCEQLRMVVCTLDSVVWLERVTENHRRNRSISTHCSSSTQFGLRRCHNSYLPPEPIFFETKPFFGANFLCFSVAKCVIFWVSVNKRKINFSWIIWQNQNFPISAIFWFFLNLSNQICFSFDILIWFFLKKPTILREMILSWILNFTFLKTYFLSLLFCPRREIQKQKQTFDKGSENSWNWKKSKLFVNRKKNIHIGMTNLWSNGNFGLLHVCTSHDLLWITKRKLHKNEEEDADRKGAAAGEIVRA